VVTLMMRGINALFACVQAHIGSAECGRHGYAGAGWYGWALGQARVVGRRSKAHAELSLVPYRQRTPIQR
jgi:hypothetical protein